MERSLRRFDNGVFARRKWARRISCFGMVTGLAMAMCGPLQAASPQNEAEKLYRLNVMLKVSGARCDAEGVNLRSDYAAFARNHRFVLNDAGRELRSQLVARHGAQGAEREYDRMTYLVADEYRQGHPWLKCSDLKVAVRGLAIVEGSETLLEAANQILPDSAAPQLASLGK